MLLARLHRTLVNGSNSNLMTSKCYFKNFLLMYNLLVRYKSDHETSDQMSLQVEPSEKVTYWTPKQPHVGEFLRYYNGIEGDAPKLFQPLTIKSMRLSNRIGMSPMCTYSTNNYEPNTYHLVHYGCISSGGPGLVIVESSAIARNGASSPNDLGLWSDNQALAHKRNIVDWAHIHNVCIGVQLGHAGRKSGFAAPFNGNVGVFLPKEQGGWPDDLVAPSAIPFQEKDPAPMELSLEQIKHLIEEYGRSARLAVEVAGYDFVEIHAGYGYLPCQFYSKTSNRRTDDYGGCFENRIRFLLEVIDSVKSSVPESIPIFLRLCTDENVEDPNGWTIEDSLRLSDELVKCGVDVLDVCSGGINSKEFNWKNPNYISPKYLAKRIKERHPDKLLVACSGSTQGGSEANNLLESGYMDLLLVGRIYLKNSGIVWQLADDLGVQLSQAVQKGWIFDAEGHLKK